MMMVNNDTFHICCVSAALVQLKVVLAVHVAGGRDKIERRFESTGMNNV
jgi:hypothetical protein